MTETTSYDVLKAAWRAGLSHQQLAAVLAEYSQSTTDLSASLSEGFVTFLAHSDLPPPVLGYLSFCLVHTLIRPSTLFDELAKGAKEDQLLRYDSLADIVQHVQVAAPEELLSRLRLLKMLRGKGLTRLPAVLLQPFALLLEPALLPPDVKSSLVELIKGAQEVELLQFASRLDAQIVLPVILPDVEAGSSDPLLPIELWQGIESMLSEGPSEEAELLVTNLVSLRCSRVGCSSKVSAIAQIKASFDAQHARPRAEGINISEVLPACLLDVLLATAKSRKRCQPAMSRGAVIWSAFSCSRLPHLLKGLETLYLEPQRLRHAVVEAIKHFQGLDAGLTPSAKSEVMDVDGPATPSAASSAPKQRFLKGFAAGCIREGLLESIDLSTLGIEMLEPTEDLQRLKDASHMSDMVEILKALLVEGADTGIMSEQLLECFAHLGCFAQWAEEKRLWQLAHLANALLSDARFLDVYFVQQPPSTLLRPICQIVDAFDNKRDAHGQAFEHIGTLTVFLQVVVQRYELSHDLVHAIGGPGDGFCQRWLRTVPTALPLHALSTDEAQLVSSWIAALYGESGLSDDLISGTNPRSLLRLAPTIIHQSIVARKIGILTADTLKDGLSYFCQELLSFTLPNILRWIGSELSRLPDQASPLALILRESLTTLVNAELTPALALELATSALQSLPSLPPSVLSVLATVSSTSTVSRPEPADALAALHAGSTTARLPALRAVLQSASNVELTRLVEMTDLPAHILALRGPTVVRDGFPLLELWTPTPGQEGKAVEARMRARAYMDAVHKLPSPTEEVKQVTEGDKFDARWSAKCSKAVLDRIRQFEIALEKRLWANKVELAEMAARS